METDSVPEKHRAVVYDKPGELSTKVVEIDTPEPGPGQVLIRIGVCHSDLSLMLNAWAGFPDFTTSTQVGGHEGIGHIARFGPDTSDKTELKLGDRVGIKWVASACLRCPPCLAGAEGLCRKQLISGYSCPGTFQEYVLSPAHYVTPIPDGLDSAVAAPLLCGGVTVYSAMRKSGAQAGDWVAVSGAGGGLGHLALQVGRAMGFRMLGLDMPGKEDLILECGAEKFVDVTGDDVAKEVQSITDGEGVTAVVVCSASNDAYATAMGLLRFNGTSVVVGMPDGDPLAIAGAIPGFMVAKQSRIVGSAVGNRREAAEMLALASRGLVTTRVTLRSMEGLGEAFEEMKAGTVRGRFVLEM
ncbi:Alcohol dehydrogenase-like protein [Hapsidospora chrysogenum ATCC 11550]|uniref:Alcohol dehydrogenase-like protein n=1 Tax=Hapsidospora chrysogenum (strain ATCC 11550 / CBS 779.69 / DSM 880 / IAM 14645 / JCM 23072 / IMI 49137) TaxID=857340 RepID=A0A086SZK8_HAPC1|nr:Alcohol dehydrogenase-like protein [Hapsidospora chrysogenum ATCC 11550]